MAGFKKVLCPVDFSGALTALTPYLRGFAEQGAQIILLHVCPDLKLFQGLYDLGRMQEQFTAKARAELAAACASLGDCQAVTGDVLCGDPAAQIVDFAKREGVDLIVMATHGHKGLEHAILGSVAENVLRTAPVPVLTVNPHRRA
ncbi:MAG: universal stress protein [Desulfarculus sp.]|nr:universal stress protein [Desulfarculus sp.]